MSKNEFRIIERNNGRGKLFIAERKVHFWFFGRRWRWRDCNEDFDEYEPYIGGDSIEEVELQLSQLYQHPYSEVVKEFSV